VPVEKAWPILLDLRKVAPCMPGAAIESGGDTDYVGRMKVKLGPIEMTYKGDLRFLERDDEAHRVKVEGIANELRGGGNAKAMITMQTSAITQGECSVAIDVDYSLSGRAAQFGSGMIDEIGGKLMKEFVTRLERLIARDEAAAPTAIPAKGAELAKPVEQMGSYRGSGDVRTSRPATVGPHSGDDHGDNEALDLVGLAWGPMLSRALPLVQLLVSVVTLVWVIVHD
jgi:carbon monoxide dehydrogenase subunit G